MKTILLAAAALAAVAGTATAADLPRRASPEPVFARPACAQFGGFYLGGNVGWGYHNSSHLDKGNFVQTIDDNLPTSARLSSDGWNAGVQGGYNWQAGCTVFGVEADWSWTDLKARANFFDGDGGTQDALSVESHMKWFGTLRTRTGVVVDNVLLYVTGGLAYANFNRNFTVFEDAPATAAVFSASSTRWGWTAGAGAEWAFAPNWSLKSEFLYMRFTNDETNHTGLTVNGVNFGVPNRGYGFDNQDDAWITRVGVNYRWGGVR